MDIETIKKLYNLSDAELAAFITECKNTGMTTNEEILNALQDKYKADNGYKTIETKYEQTNKPEVTAPNIPDDEEFDKTDYIPKVKEYNIITKTDKPSILKRLGLWYQENKNSDEQNNASTRKVVTDSIRNWRNNTTPAYRMGLLQAIFGDNSLLNSTYANKFSAEQAEKNRQAQLELANLNKGDSGFSKLDEALNNRENAKYLRDTAMPNLRATIALVEDEANKTLTKEGKPNYSNVSKSTIAKLKNAMNVVENYGGDPSEANYLFDENGNFNTYGSVPTTVTEAENKDIKTIHDTAIKDYNAKVSKLGKRKTNKNYENDYNELKLIYNYLLKEVQDNPNANLDNPKDLPVYEPKPKEKPSKGTKLSGEELKPWLGKIKYKWIGPNKYEVL